MLLSPVYGKCRSKVFPDRYKEHVAYARERVAKELAKLRDWLYITAERFGVFVL